MKYNFKSYLIVLTIILRIMHGISSIMCRKLKEILYRIMQRIMSIIISAISQCQLNKGGTSLSMRGLAAHISGSFAYIASMYVI